MRHRRALTSILVVACLAATQSRCGSGIDDSMDDETLPISVFAVGSGGRIFRSSDGGVSFAETEESSSDLNGIAFKNTQTGVVVGNSGAVLVTQNGGDDWAAPSTPPSGTITWMDVAFSPTTSTAVAVGAGGNYTKTSNVTGTWTAPTTTGGGPLISAYSVAFSDATLFVMVGDDGGTQARRTTDLGISFGAPNIQFDPANDITFIPTLDGWAVGAAGSISTSIDDGANWTTQNSDTTDSLFAVHFVDVSTGWAAGANGTVTRTINGGSTWTSSSVYDGSNAIVDIAFVDALIGFVLTDDGRVFRSKDGGENWSLMVDLGNGPFAAMAAFENP